MSMKTIYILLTRSDTLLSRVVQLLSDAPYTHTSISFDHCLQPLYSSARKNGVTMFPAGPTTEVFHRGFYYTHRDIPCILYELTVPDEVYEAARAEARRYARDSHLYRFNILGLLLCRLQIPYHPRNKYFCSQFVAEILAQSGALVLPKDTSLMRPMDYTQLPQLTYRYRGRLRDLVRERTGLA